MKTKQSQLKICLLGAILLLPAVMHAQFTFTINNGAITITGYTGAGGIVTIPSSTNGYPVKAIGANAFRNKANVTSVAIANSVTSIGNQAFNGCSALTSMTIPSSVTNIGAGAFGSCLFLSTAYFQGNAPTVNGGLGSSDSTVFSGRSTFYQESGVVYFPPGATGWGATFGSWPTVCTGSNTPASSFSFVTNNGSIIITGYISTNPDVVMPDSINGYPITTIGTNAFNGLHNNSTLRSMILPNSVTEIQDSAFNNCFDLLTVNMPNNLTSIGNQAFYNCWGLTWVTIPTTVTNIGSDAFYEPGLLNISVAAGNPNYASLGGVLFDNAFTTLIQYPGSLGGSYVIPNSVITIGTHAFCSNHGGPSSVTIPNSVTSIGSWAFDYCYPLANIAVAADNTNYASAGGVLFDKSLATLIQYPKGLQQSSYIIPSSVTNIASAAFRNCNSLVNVAIPNSVTSIGSNALVYCQYLTSITVAADNPNYASVGGVLFDKLLMTLIQYPSGLHQASYNIPNSVTDIGVNAFALSLGLTNVVIPNSVTIIESSAFSSCYYLTNVTIPSSVVSMGSAAFEYCSRLNQAYFQGNAPSVNGGTGSADSTVFYGELGTAYYVPGTTGWGTNFGGWTTAMWYQPHPQILGSGSGFDVPSNGFQFTISWATNTAIVVEASIDLQSWTPVITNTLVSGTNAFMDAKWTNYPQRFYRVRSP